MTKAQKLRQRLQRDQILKVMGGHNALGAKLIEKNGFDAVWASGFEVSTAHGVPDANILTMTENLDVASNINEATKLPVICDCDTGYGNANNVMHMMKRYESAGIAGVVIEDKHFPKVNSFIPGRQELATIDEFVGKIEAARNARQSEDGTMIFARVEALIAGWGMTEAVRRAEAYVRAGADGIVIHSKSRIPDEIFTFARIWRETLKSPCPLVAIPTTYHMVTCEELAREDFKIVIYANQGMRAMVRGLDRVLSRIQREGSTRNIEPDIATMKEIFELQGMQTYQEHEKLYSRKGEQITAVIPAAADHQFQPELSKYLKDKPLCMLEVGGKPLLERQIDLLRSAGIPDFRIVTGYQSSKIEAPGIRKIENIHYKNRGSAYSVIRGLEHVKGKVVICYSDIIFDRQIAESLVKSPYPITLVIDRAFQSLPRRDKSLDMVVTQEAEKERMSRRLTLNQFKKIRKIGKKIDGGKASQEFIGMAMLSPDGLESLKAIWIAAQKKYQGKPFHEAESFERCSFTDLLQEAIDQALNVNGLEIDHGWSEIYSLDDYERINAFFADPVILTSEMNPVTL